MNEASLSWFDRLMIGITFAESGVEAPASTVRTKTTERRHGGADGQVGLLGPGQDSSCPVHP